MKKHLFVVIALLLGAMSVKAQSSLDTTQIDGIWYILDRANHTATVTYGPGEMGGIGQDTYAGRLIIPEYVNLWDAQEGSMQYPVTAIGDQAFAWCTNLTGITIPKTVQTLGLNLLQRSGSVTELKIADGETPIYFRYNQGELGAEISFQELAYTCTYLYLGRNVELISDLEWAMPVFHTWSEVQNVVLGEHFTEVPLAFCPYARNLQTIQLNMSSVLTPGPQMFAFLDEDNPQPDASLITLYVPTGTRTAYEAHAFWGRFTIEEMDEEQRYGIKFVDRTKDFYKDGLYYKVMIEDSTEQMVRLAVVIPQVWYLNPDGSYVSQWSVEYPYMQSAIDIPDSVTFYRYKTSYDTKYSGTYWEGWSKFTLPVEIIDSYCFRGATNLQRLTIPASVYYIGGEAFEDAMKLKRLTIPETVTEVGWLTFARSGLEEVVIPASSSNWGFGEGMASFQECHNLTKATFAEGTTRVQDRIFFGCDALRTIIIPEGVTEIGAGAFAGCEALTELNLPNSLEVMGDRMLRGCPIRSLVIPANVREIAPSGLLGAALSKLSVDSANQYFDSREGCNAIIRKADNSLIAAANGAFIPSSVDSIETEAFSELSGIRSLTLPAGLKKVAWGAFMNLENLTLITSDIQNPAGVLDENAFSSWYSDPYEVATLYIPAGTLAAYQADSEWAKFQHIVELAGENIPASVEDIEPIAENGTTSMAGLAENTDLSNAVVDNLYLTCDTTNGDHYDATEQALVLNTVVDEVMMENVLANPTNMDAVRNNFSGIIFTIPAGTGSISLTVKTSGNREIAVMIAGQEAESFAQAVKGLISIPYEVENDAYVFVYGIAPDEEAQASAPSKFSARAKRALKTENSVSIYDVQWVVESTTGIEDVQDKAQSTKILRDGQLLILKDGKMYNALGVEMK